MSEWRPIETAPRDGTEILGAWRFIHGWTWCIQPIAWLNGDWAVTWDHDNAQPTHWMHLPDPPEDV